MSGGVKFDQGKPKVSRINPDFILQLAAAIPEGRTRPRFDLIPPSFLIELADILEFGADKYGERNWEKGFDWSRPYDALMRHMLDWWALRSIDLETAKSHLSHGSCNLAFLQHFEKHGVGRDDRSERPVEIEPYSEALDAA